MRYHRRRMILARCNGVELVRRDGEVWIVVRPAPPTVALFVLWLVAAITAINALVQAMVAVRGGAGHAIAAAVLIAVAALAGGIAVLVRRYGKRRAAVEPRPLFILDVAGKRLCDPQGRVLAPLQAVSVAQTMQLASSSAALTLRWPGGTSVIARGSPFGESVDGCEAVLRAQLSSGT
jgi:hypothetical protein